MLQRGDVIDWESFRRIDHRMTRGWICEVLKRWHDARRIYVSEWVTCGTSLRPLYMLGKKADARRPEPAYMRRDHDPGRKAYRKAKAPPVVNDPLLHALMGRKEPS